MTSAIPVQSSNQLSYQANWELAICEFVYEFLHLLNSSGFRNPRPTSRTHGALLTTYNPSDPEDLSVLVTGGQFLEAADAKIGTRNNVTLQEIKLVV